VIRPPRLLLAAPLALLLAACAGPQRIDYHLAGGAVAFADGQDIGRADAQAVVDEVARTTASPEYRARALELVAQEFEAWHLARDDGYGQLDLAWHGDVIDESQPEDGYAERRATSAPADWFAIELPRAPAGAVIVRLEAATALSPDEEGYRLALVPQAAFLAVGGRSVPGELARAALQAVRRSQLELLRRACEARGWALFGE